MGGEAIILSYVQSCVGGKLGFADCSPLWQLGVILGFILLLVVALLVLRYRSRADAPEKA